MASLFGNKKTTVTQEPLIPDWQLKTGEGLSAWIQQFLNQYQPGQAYGGDLTAGMTGAESTGLDQLANFLKSPNTGDLFSAGEGQIMDTLGGKFADPNASPYIKAMMSLANMNLGDEINATRARRGARGSYYTKAGLQEERQLSERTLNNLNAVVGDWLNSERGRQFSAAPIAQSMDQHKNITAPLAKIGASQTFGSLQRTIEQADLERKYQDFVRQRRELGNLPQAAESLYGTSVPYGVKSMTTKSPSPFMAMLGEVMPMIGSYNTAAYGYDVNQASLSQSMKDLSKILMML